MAARNQVDRVVGFVVAFLAIAVTCYAAGFLGGLLLFLCLFLLYALVMFLLRKNSPLSRTAAALLLPTTILLRFPPKPTRDAIDRLKAREKPE